LKCKKKSAEQQEVPSVHVRLVTQMIHWRFHLWNGERHDWL